MPLKRFRENEEGWENGRGKGEEAERISGVIQDAQEEGGVS
jgi:hypothetical protein